MRKKSTLLNSIFGVINKIVSIFFVFLVRHFFVKYLSSECLGLEGLFSNILGLFSLVDLGLGSAISFNLYEPIHRKDRNTISAIMQLYRKLYVLIGIVVFALALSFSPFIAGIIKDRNLPANDVRVFFLIYAFGVAITYLFSYKRTMIFALQKNYIALNVDTVIKAILSVLQIITIIRYHSYGLYLTLVVVFNLLGNVIISAALNRENLYDKKVAYKLPDSFIKKLKEHVKALAITNVAWQCIASTDNIIISAIVGVIDLAKNANYSTISNSISNVILVFLGGASASIGDLLVEKNKENIKKYFDRYCFIYAILSGYALLGIYFISDSVISIWVGTDLLFEKYTVFVIAINIVLALNFRPLADYLNYSGNFVYYKPYSIIAVFINFAFSIILGKFIGIIGVFIGTTVTYSFMTISVIFLLYKHLFVSKMWDYYKHMFIVLLPIIISFMVLSIMPNYSGVNPVLDIVMSFALVTVIYFATILVVLWKNEEFQFYLELLRKIIRNRSIKGL